MIRNKVVSAEEAVAIIRDGDTLANSGFVGNGTPDELLPHDRGLRHTDPAADVRTVLQTSGASTLSMIGYCMGAPCRCAISGPIPTLR